MQQIISSAIMRMTSVEIADMVEKRHDNVKRTIETLAEQGVISPPQIEEVKIKRERREESVAAYVFEGEKGKRDSIVVVAQLSPEFTARLVDRWQELESEKAKTALIFSEEKSKNIDNIRDVDHKAFAAVQAVWFDAVERNIVSKREALAFLRESSSAMIYGVNSILPAKEFKPSAESLPQAKQAEILPRGTVNFFNRNIDAMSATMLLKKCEANISAKEFNDLLDQVGMMETRQYKYNGVPTSYRVLIGDGVDYGENVLHESGTHSAPRFYPGKFKSLLDGVCNACNGNEDD